MYAFPPPRNQHERTWAWMGSVFSYEEIGRLCAYAEGLPQKEAEIGAGTKGAELHEVRNSDVAWVGYNETSAWIYTRVAEKLMEANERWFRFNLWGFVDALQYTVYDSAKQGHYNWHLDINGEGLHARKLSFVIQLSKPEVYEGGELRIQGRSEEILPKTQGHMLIFPSYARHKVSPVTSGVRRSLVGWAAGFEFS